MSTLTAQIFRTVVSTISVFFLIACSRTPQDSPAYIIDFVADPPTIEHLSNRQAIVSGNVLQRSNLKPTELNYTITIDLSGGPVQNDTIAFPSLAGRGPTRFANNIEPQITTAGGRDVLGIRLLGVVGVAEEPQEGRGVTYYRDNSSQALVSLRLGELIELTNVGYTLTGIDGALTGIDCEPAEPNNYACGGAFIDRVTMMSGDSYTYDAVDAEQVMVLDDTLTARYPDTNNSGYPDHAFDGRVSADDDAGNVTIFHAGNMGETLIFRFDDVAKGIDGDPDKHHDFDAPEASIGLASGITFDIIKAPPPPTPTPDPNLTTISGIVFGDENGNGLQDAGETGLNADKMVLYEMQEGTLLQAMTTTVGIDAQFPGVFMLEGVLAGTTYRLEALIPMEPTAAGGILNPLRLIQIITPSIDGPNRIDFAAWPFELDSVDESELLLPDMQPLTHYPIPPGMSEEVQADLARSYPGMEQWYLDMEEQPGHVLLRFGTLATNLGEGPLHIIGGEETEAGRPVHQRLYTPSGSYVERLVNDFVFQGERDERVHIEAFERYNLRDFETDQIVVSSPKASFCLTDVLWAIEPDIHQTASVATVPMGWTCGPVEQSVNVGFSDYYGPALPDQWIDVTDVPSGVYWLEVIDDPDNRLLESDESNNRVRIEIEFTNPLMEEAGENATH